jgi:hypothetical protein
LKTTWTVIPKKLRPKPHDVDYFVPNFGEDRDIKEVNESEEQARAQVWRDRLSGQIGVSTAEQQIQVNALEYRRQADLA